MSDVSKTNDDLIKRARGLAAHSYGGVSRTLRELTDALEAATRVPAQGEPNDDREMLVKILEPVEALIEGAETLELGYEVADAILTAGFSRATVPDAATEALGRVRSLHKPDPYDVRGEYCTCEEAWPCSTITALDGAPEPDMTAIREARAETWDEAISTVFAWWNAPEQERPAMIVNPYGVGLPVEGESKP